MDKLSKFHPRWSPKNSIFPSRNQFVPSKLRFSKASKILAMLASIFVRSRPQLEAILGPKLGPSRPPKSPTSRPGRLPRRAWEPESAKTTPQDAPRRPKFLQNASQTPLKEALIFHSSCAFENDQICSHRIYAWKYINPANDFKFRQGVGGMGEALLDYNVTN